MRAFEITEVKAFMSALLVGSVFDNFALSELKMNNAGGFVIDGHRNRDFYDEEEFESLPEKEFLLWSEVKNIVYDMVKGNKQPVAMQIAFRLNSVNTGKTINNSGITVPLEQVGGIFLNIRYDRTALTVTSGTALKTFSMDRSLENTWDEFAERFLKKNQLI